MVLQRMNYSSIMALSWVNLGSVATLRLVSDGSVANGCFSDSEIMPYIHSKTTTFTAT
jgi:hypothetical protein